MFKSLLFIIASIGLLQSPILKASDINNPLRPPAFALQKYQQEKNKNKPKAVVIKTNPVKEQALQLTSILVSSTRSIAIIDEQMLSVGDSIKGAKLMGIKKDSVRLIKKGKVINLRLSNQSMNIRKTAIQKTTGEKKL